MSDPINPDETNPTDPPADQPTDEPTAAPAFTPQAGDIVRLDDPDADGTPRYALFIAENEVVPLQNAQRYELQLYPTS